MIHVCNASTIVLMSFIQMISLEIHALIKVMHKYTAGEAAPMEVESGKPPVKRSRFKEQKERAKVRANL